MKWSTACSDFNITPLPVMNDFNSPFNAPFNPPPVPPAEQVADAVHDLKAAAEAKAREFGQAAGEKLHEFKDAAGRVMGDTSVRWKELGDQAVAYVKENPGKSVLAGLGAGFLIGLLFRDK
jgi:ElaB/YqjD/DUF883 family membrane-anchored ribosome-binding protein